MEKLGPSILNKEPGKVLFRCYAHDRKGVKLLIRSGESLIEFPMKQERPHLFTATVEEKGVELQYKYSLRGEKNAYPDPYSHYQSTGVDGFSQVWDHDAYRWKDEGWPGIDWPRSIIYELHPGTFTARGTFKSAAEKLDYLLELGINTVELMPVTQTPGRWNWGYDGANLFSVNHSYGSPDDLKYFVDTCHGKGLAVILDVVYNHFGPEGNYLAFYGPYFTKKHETAWGQAVNFDDAGCEAARAMVVQNVRHWVELFHFDGLRLDAVHAIRDGGPRHILQEIAGTAKELSGRLGREIIIIAETDENDVKLIKPPDEGGYGLDAQWMDDFHHTVHTALTGENKGYYMDYRGIEGLEKVYRNYLYTGEYSAFWRKNRGTDGSACPGRQFVAAIQTHDQVGNRAEGERLTRLVCFPFLKAAAGLLFMAPYIPMLFMGEEYAEENPFLFFTDYEDPELKQAVSQGRRKEFAGFGWKDVPDPEDDNAFFASKLTPLEQWSQAQKQIFAYYRDLIKLRKEHPALQNPEKNNLDIQVDARHKLVVIRKHGEEKTLAAFVNLGREKIALKTLGGMTIIDSENPIYGGRHTETRQNSNLLLPGQFLLVE